MKSELKVISPTQKEIHLQIDADEVRDAYGRVSQKYAKRASVPGFRKGMVPLDVVRMRFKEEIKSDVLQEVIPPKVTDAIREHELQPLAEPELHLENHETVKVNGSEPLNLHVHVEVMPEIPEPNYKGIEVVRRVKPVEDGEVEDLIAERLQREMALIPVEGRASRTGDTVIVDLEGRFDESPDAEPITATDLEIVLGDELIEKSFTENLAGVKEDENKEFTVAYPETFTSPALAGKTVHYKAKVKSVGVSEMPELNDEWAKSLDEGYKSLADLRTRLKADLENVSAADADSRVRNNAVAKLIETNPFEVPNTLIETQTRNLLNDFARDLQQRGVDMNQVEQSFIEMAYSNMRQQGERDVRGAILLDKVAMAETVEVSDDEVDAEIAKMAQYYRTTPEEMRSQIEKQGGGVENIGNNLRTRKSVEAIMSHATVTEGDWVDEAAAAAVPAEKSKKKAPAGKAAKK
ncbi:MAG: trigger factor [Pyrinomonadaceae bacterium]|nr:trigger factor [Pyrinomonadaceae bacterium]